MSEKVKILYVDDEENNLNSFRANFRKEYQVFTALNAKNAFEVLKENNINIIISDQRMPETTGVEFLEQTVKLYPESVRLLITGQADIEVVIEAINRGQVSKYIQKPWDWEKLAIALDNCATIYQSREELKLKNKELHKINEELNKFVYSVSHDLRSPLTSIMGVINLTKLIPELRPADTYFEMIEGRIHKLDDLIKKIINYYKNAGAEDVVEEINFTLLVSSVWELLKYQNSDISFNLNVDQKTIFKGDFYRLEVVFENLISNAIKYQYPGNKNAFINIEINVDEKNAIILLSDNGIGINPKYIDSIFKLFFRSENSINVEGTGIGLYIVKEAMEKMGGHIKVFSGPSQGTSFELIIPNICSNG